MWVQETTYLCGSRSDESIGSCKGWQVGDFGTFVSCAATDKPIEMPVGGLTQVGPRNNESDRGQGRTNPFAAKRGDKSAMRHLAKLLWTLVNFDIGRRLPLRRRATSVNADLTLWADPLEWSREQVAAWLHWLVGQCDLDARRGPAELGKLTTLNGRQLSRLSRDDIARLTRNAHVAEMIWSSFNLLLSTAKGTGRSNGGSRPLFHAKFRRNYHSMLIYIHLCSPFMMDKRNIQIWTNKQIVDCRQTKYKITHKYLGLIREVRICAMKLVMLLLCWHCDLHVAAQQQLSADFIENCGFIYIL